MLRDGHVDGLATDGVVVLFWIDEVTWTCEPEALMASSSNAAAAEAWRHDLGMSLSSSLHTCSVFTRGGLTVLEVLFQTMTENLTFAHSALPPSAGVLP